MLVSGWRTECLVRQRALMRCTARLFPRMRCVMISVSLRIGVTSETAVPDAEMDHVGTREGGSSIRGVI